MKRRAPALCLRFLLILGTAFHTVPAHAETWRVDLIVFRYLGTADEAGQMPVAPDLRRAIELDDAQHLSAAGITLLPDSDFGLADHWTRLRSSPQFRPLIRLAWTQNDPPPDNGPRLHLRSGAKLTLASAKGLGVREFQEVDGSVALHLGRFLHLDADLLFTEAGDPPATWRLDERRRMRSDELHHLDSPRLGVIVKVGKWVPKSLPVP